MAELPIIIDSCLWSDLKNLFETFRRSSGKSFDELWRLEDDDPVLLDFRKDKRSDKFNAYDKLREMIRSYKKYVVHIPNYIYNEVGRSVSSKMNSVKATGNEKYVNDFMELVNSLPFEKKMEKFFPLKVGKDFPKKSEKHTERRHNMREFLEELNDPKVKTLLNHLRKADVRKKKEVNYKTLKMKEAIKVVQNKFKNWDKHMIQASKTHDLPPYESKTMMLNKLFSRITGYTEDARTIKFDKPLERLIEKLAPENIPEEFDFFDLQIYLYAKENKAPILTVNTQAFQEINDPHFLGYFDDIRVVHPYINFEILDDLYLPRDLNEVIVRAMTADLYDLDLDICKKLDAKLDYSNIATNADYLITDSVKQYDQRTINMEIKFSLGELLQGLRIENGRLKVSQTFLTGEVNQKTLDALLYIDQEFFNGLKSKDFIKDGFISDEQATKMLKGKSIADHLAENEIVKKNLLEFQTNGKPYLDTFLERYKGKSFQEAKGLFHILDIGVRFSKTEIDLALNPSETRFGSVALPEECLAPAKMGSRKRQTNKCVLDWEKIEEFNDGELESRDPQKVKIDSEKFLDYLKTVKDPLERMQLIEFADKVINLGEDHMSKISGPKVDEVTHLTNKRKVLEHFSKLHRVSGALNYGLFAKNLLGDILHGDIKAVAFNVGFMVGGHALSTIAAASLAKGTEFAEAGRVLLGNSMKFASPFISRFLSPLIILDLLDQIKALEKGDKDALVGVIGDGVFLIIDAVEIGVSLLEIAGIIAEVSSFTGPIGMAVGVVVMIATDVFMATRKVDKIDNIIHLTGGEKWEWYTTTILTFGLVKLDFEKLVPLKDANNQLAKKALEALQKSEEIQRIVVPSAQLAGENEMEMTHDNQFTPYDYESSVKWQRVRPDDPKGGRIFCAPEGDWENPPSWIMGRCTNAIGIADLTEKKQNFTLFSLGDGQDTLRGFQDSPNIFRIGTGKKDFKGGDKNDVFVLEQGLTLDNFPEGTVDGMGGSNILDIGGFSDDLYTQSVSVFFQEEPLGVKINGIIDLFSHWSHQLPMDFLNIDSILGRENVLDFIYTNCSTKYVDGRGGYSFYADQIHIPHTYKECNHDKVIKLGSNTLVVNEAITGKFSYFVNDVHSFNKCTLKRSEPYKKLVKDPSSNRIEHKFFVNGTISEVVKFEFHHEKDDYDVDIRMYFKDTNGTVNMFNLETTLGYGKNNGGMDNLVIYLKDDVELRYHQNGIYALVKSDKPVPDLINKYHPIAVDFDISVFIFAEKEDAIISIGSNQKDDVLHNDPLYKTYLVANEGNNTYIIVSGQDFLVGPDPPMIADVEIYCANNENHINTLDLRAISQQIKEDLGMELLIKHTFYLGKVVIQLYAVDRDDMMFYSEEDSYKHVTTITFRDPQFQNVWESWCSRLHVILNKFPVLLRCDAAYFLDNFQPDNVIDYYKDVIDYDPSNYYTPLPLYFSGHEMVAISEEDVEPNTEIVVMNPLGQYRFLRHHDDLILTNGFDFKKPVYQPTSLMIKNFYKDPSIFYSLVYRFDDVVINLGLEHDQIDNATHLEDMYEEYDSFANHILGDHTRRNRRDLEEIEDPLNRRGFNGLDDPESSVPRTYGTVLSSLTEMGRRTLNYFHSYFKPLFSKDPNVDFSDGNGIRNEKILDSKTNIPLSNESEINYTNFNSTLLLLDTLVRKLSDSKYKLRTEDYLLSPPEHVQKKMFEETKKLGLDYNDIGGSIEKQHQQLLNNLKEK